VRNFLLDQELKEETLLPCYFFFGEEPFLARQFIQQLREILIPPDAPDYSLERFDLGTANLASGESRTFQVEWTPAKEGEYKLVARAYYGNEATRKETAFTVSAQAAPAAPTQAAVTAKEEAQNVLYSPYTAIIAILGIMIIIVLLWPKKKKG
jgi:hypothetical protein